MHLEYGPIRQRLAEVVEPTAVDVSRAVCAIRSEKLPDPRELGNAGSFFKNPLVSAETAHALRAAYPDLVAYPQDAGLVKLAAGWLIERAGWKGFRDGDAGVHRLQALVLVNHGQATGEQLLGWRDGSRPTCSNASMSPGNRAERALIGGRLPEPARIGNVRRSQ